MVLLLISLYSLLITITLSTTTISTTECISKLSSCPSVCEGLSNEKLICQSNDNSESCGWTTKKCECKCEDKPINTDYESTDFGVFDKIIKYIISKFKAITCLNEQSMWDTFGKLVIYPQFFLNIIETSQNTETYNAIKLFVLQFHSFYDNNICEVDHFIRNKISILNPLASNDGKSDAVGADIDNLLSPIYESIKQQIDGFSELLTDKEKETALAITYTGNVCLDIEIEICYAVGFGFAFNFLGEIYYYQTGVQALTLQSTDDLGSLPGSISFDIAYDILGNISYAPGNLYSLDASISGGILTKLITASEQSSTSEIKNKLLSGGYSISYLVGVNNLDLSIDNLDQSKCLGLSFGHSLNSIEGGIIPSAAFGISRVATTTSTQITENKNKGNEFDNNQCIAEQLWSVTGFGQLIRPDIEI